MPIPFQELYVLGKEYKAQVDAAYEELDNINKTFGSFRSPSTVDTRNFYDITLGKYKDLVDAAAANPELMKNGQFRSQLMQRDASLDYAAINMLKESADNLRKGEEMRAKMMAEGTYNPNWDMSNIPEYDTLGRNAVFQDITPVKWMSANQLSNTYFDNLEMSELGSVWKDGVKYNRMGVTENTLHGISEARFNDLVATPQGQMYYRDFLQRYDGDANAAKNAFVNMIADSQRDRLRVKDTVDTGWLQLALANARNKGKSGSGASKNNGLPTRQERMTYDIANRSNRVYGQMFDKESEDAMKSARARNMELAKQANDAILRYNESGSENDFAEVVRLQNQMQSNINSVYDLNRSKVMKDAFKRTSNFDLTMNPEEAEGYSRKGYNRGVKAALDEASTTVGIRENDALFTELYGRYHEYTLASGMKTNVYDFASSQGFLLPEELFALSTGINQVKIYDRDMIWDDEIMLKEALHNNLFGSVQFVPDGTNNLVQYGDNKAISGVLRIPAEAMDDVIGTEWRWIQGTGKIASLKDEVGLKEVEYKDGDNTRKFYEIPIYRMLPDDYNLEYWSAVNALDHNSPTHGGLGGATQTKEQMSTIIESSLDRNYD